MPRWLNLYHCHQHLLRWFDLELRLIAGQVFAAAIGQRLPIGKLTIAAAAVAARARANATTPGLELGPTQQRRSTIEHSLPASLTGFRSAVIAIAAAIGRVITAEDAGSR